MPRRCAPALLAPAVLAAILAAALVGCGAPNRTKAPTPRAGLGTAPAVAARATQAPPPAPSRAPGTAYAVGSRQIFANRGGDRPMRITVWYPATGRAGGAPRTGSPVAAGRFPVVVFSHGLTGLPSDYRALLSRWAAAGFVVAAPAYPHTSRGVARFDVVDVVNQPADASYALSIVLALDGAAGDPLRRHLRRDRIAAAGHSAGAITTVGLFTAGRDKRLVAGVVLAGNAVGVGDRFTGPAVPLLFVHGDTDPVTPYGLARAAYARAPWPKAFLTMPGQGHIDPYVLPDAPAFAGVAATTTDFLRWTLYGDATAKARLARDAARAGTLENRL
jgi:fermentation-respiration switch protein FrsA (DUF1100 family)